MSYRALKSLATVLLLALFATLCWQVISRYLLSEPSTFTEELSRLLLIWFGLTGGGALLIEKKHIALDFFVARFSSRTRRIIEWVEVAATFLFSVVLLVGGVGIVRNAAQLGQETPVLKIPLAWVYVVIPLVGAAVLIQAVSERAQEKSTP